MTVALATKRPELREKRTHKQAEMRRTTAGCIEKLACAEARQSDAMMHAACC